MAMSETFAQLGEEAKRIPWWGWVGGAVAGFFVVQHFLGAGSSQTVTAPAVTDPSTGVGSDGTSVSADSGGAVGTTGTPNPPAQSSTGSSTTPATPAPTPAAPAPTQTYTVQPGDTLSGIGQHYGIDWQNIYSSNQGTIENTARAHGFADSDHGHWIFPGEQLQIPAA